MAEINLGGAFSFLDNIKKIALVALVALVGYFGYLFKDDISVILGSTNKLDLIERVVQLTDDDIISAGYWVLNKETDYWECKFAYSSKGYEFCYQTGSFYNSSFVKKFQLKLEQEDVVVVTIRPGTQTFEQYWKGIYTTVFGVDKDTWGDPLYIIYFQVGDTTDTRRVIYSLDKNDAREGRKLTTEFTETILDEV